MKYFRNDVAGVELAEFVHECAIAEARLKYGVSFNASEYVHMLESQEYCQNNIKALIEGGD